MILAFTKVSGPYGWLSNMSPHPIVDASGVTWRTSEALFQAMRFDEIVIRERIRAQTSPMAAKMIAKGVAEHMTVVQRSEEDLNNMRVCLKHKLEQHQSLQTLLLQTEEATLVEDVSRRPISASNLFWGMRFAGTGWDGSNWLGKLWMELRLMARCPGPRPQLNLSI